MAGAALCPAFVPASIQALASLALVEIYANAAYFWLDNIIGQAFLFFVDMVQMHFHDTVSNTAYFVINLLIGVFDFFVDIYCYNYVST